MFSNRHPRTELSRRKFLARTAVAGGTVAATAILADPVHAQEGNPQLPSCETSCELDDLMVVWHLQTDWGFPRGPHGKTKLKSKASKIAAKHRWALTEQDALDMNLHLCSWAPAVPVLVNKCAFMSIWDHDGAGSYTWANPWNGADVNLFDTRCLAHIENGDAVWADAFDVDCDATVDDVLSNIANAASGSGLGTGPAAVGGAPDAAPEPQGENAISESSDAPSELAFSPDLVMESDQGGAVQGAQPTSAAPVSPVGPTPVTPETVASAAATSTPTSSTPASQLPVAPSPAAPSPAAPSPVSAATAPAPSAQGGSLLGATPPELAFTGGESGVLVGAGAGMVAAGALAIILKRRTEVAAAEAEEALS